MTTENFELLAIIGIVIGTIICFGGFIYFFSIETEELARILGVTKPDAQKDA